MPEKHGAHSKSEFGAGPLLLLNLFLHALSSGDTCRHKGVLATSYGAPQPRAQKVTKPERRAHVEEQRTLWQDKGVDGGSLGGAAGFPDLSEGVWRQHLR